MIRVERHVRGIAVSATDGLDRNKRMRELEIRLGPRKGLSSGGHLIVPTEAAATILDILGIEGVLWDDGLLLSAQRKQGHQDSQMRARLEVARALEDPHTILADYERVQRLDPHQVEAVAAIISPSLKGIAIFDEQGTGKTIMALAAFDWLHELGKIKRLLVVAPKSVLAVWQRQCAEFLGGQYRVALLAGSASARRRCLLSSHDILLVGYEAAVASEKLLFSIVSARPASYMLVIDESYLVKNPATVRAQVVRRLRTACERAVVLCGTPAPNSAVDIVNQVDIADGGVAFAGRFISKDIEAAYAEVASGLQEAIYIRRLKGEVLPEIPSKQVEKIYLQLSKSQRYLYDQARDELAFEARNANDQQFAQQLSSFLAKRVRLLQICSNPMAIDSSYDEMPAKICVLDRLVKELVEEQGKKVVIWSYFKVSLNEIVRRYSKYGIARIDGSIARVEDRLKAVERFQSDPGTHLFVGNAAAAGAGITLTAAHHAVYESFSNQAAHYLQSVDRIHRRGQAEEVVSHILIARDTIEENEYRRLVRKERTGRELLGDRYEEPMTRERFIAALEA